MCLDYQGKNIQICSIIYVFHYITKKLTSKLFNYQHPSLEQKILGIKFKNPIGLSAGFDKNADLINIMGSVGFGFVEIGSVTAHPFEGNPGTRLKRIVDKESLYVNIGLKNEGSLTIKNKLKNKKFKIPYGINIAKTNCKENVAPKNAIKDYIFSLKTLKSFGSYFTINISCPNAFGGQPFTSPELYSSLLYEIEKLKIKKPVFIKLSPDLNKKQIDSILEISENYSISGFICTNLTKKRLKNTGGYSGKLVEKSSNNLLSYVYKKLKNKNKKYILIGSGGISSTEDAFKKISLGANLVQLITGMIYQGPSLIGKINYDLVKILEKKGFKSISEAVGSANK